MLESLFQVCPPIGFHCLGGPGFSKHTIITYRVNYRVVVSVIKYCTLSWPFFFFF